MRLSNKVCLVTGASRGIGRASALALAQEGAAVAAVARTKSDLDELTRTIEAKGGRAKSIVCDATSSSDVRSCVKQASRSCKALRAGKRAKGRSQNVPLSAKGIRSLRWPTS